MEPDTRPTAPVLPAPVPAPGDCPVCVADASAEFPAPGRTVYTMNPKYRDGTRLRAGSSFQAPFNGVWVPNDEAVEVLGAADLPSNAAPGRRFVHVKRHHTGESGWILARNLWLSPREVGFRLADVRQWTGGSTPAAGCGMSMASSSADSAPFAPRVYDTRTCGDGSEAVRTSRFHFDRTTGQLGAGSFGTVFRGFDLSTGSAVAVKTSAVTRQFSLSTPPGGAGEAAMSSPTSSLAHEFQLLRQLEHPNVVRVLGLELDEHEVRVVMEWMPGGSLADVLRQTGVRLHERVLRRYLADALNGLAYLHARSLLHCDVKPGNMLLGADGVVKLSDFGTCRLARSSAVGSLAGSAGTTGAGRAVGTIPYMSRHALEGRASPADDVWAFACTAVELAGERPWWHLPPEKRGEVQLMYHIGTAQPPDHCPHIPVHLSAELRKLLAACFDSDPGRRPSAAALLETPYFAAAGKSELPDDAETFDAYQSAIAAAVAAAAASPVEPWATTAQGARTGGAPETWVTATSDSQPPARPS